MLENFTKFKQGNYENLYHNFKINTKSSFNFAYDVVDKWAEISPNKRAIAWCDDKGSEREFSFKDIKFYSDKTANMLREQGIGKGDVVMVVLKRRYEFWFTILALHKLGAICIPATHLLTKKDYIYRNNAADVKMIVTVNDDQILDNIDASQKDSQYLTKKVVVGGSRDGWLNFDSEVDKASDIFNPSDDVKDLTSTDISLLYFTSGTTGNPKMVSHNFDYPLGHIVTAKYWHNVVDDGLHLTVADTGWAKAVWGKIYGQWICGSAVMVYDYDRFNAQEMLSILSKYKVTTFCAPPTVYRFMIKEDFSKYDLSSLSYCTTAGEPLSPKVFNTFYDLTGLKLMEAYGQTELTVTIGNFTGMIPKPGSMGKAAPGYVIEIIDKDGNLCKEGDVGQIALRLDISKPIGMFIEYYRDKAKTDEVRTDKYYLTGDTAYMDQDGYYWFVGRSDDIIKSSGYRIGPFEVESALMTHPAVLECAVTGVSDDLRGQIVKATIVLVKGVATSLDKLKKEIQDHVKSATAPYKYPRVIEFVENLPKTISGKVRRVEIRNKKKD
ncbi:acetyl-CoA synthetase [Thiospirochaeta perfilievii]|uniref:Acetyl-CoA synthetase n=1 Tax=Thiospirochaeta perfilievii TaxID=252967 RepID=A0A5C1QAH3_9SPIO|nr:AMP-binding protein [Thiospirochaeta perfilievii]QEN04338.1 acetyl-CoA synthetase [Thiospirochaeta perfilievii]